ncbi:MAG: PAS domain-containing protein, partial [Chitinivibrionales bacterium]|nr:PAS domain-containing protein [Chitinivibrionales bacterium]
QGRVAFAIATGIDITDRRQAEKALRESRADLNRAQELAKTGSWRLNIGKDALDWSDEAYRIFEIPRGTPMTYETFLDRVHPDDRAYVDRKWQAALRGEGYDIEHRIVTDGATKWVRERGELEFAPNGNLRGGFGAVQDITERKRLEDDLKRRADDLATANAELESFSYSVSHDLRNPLNNVMAMTDVLKHRALDMLDDKGKRCITEIDSSTYRMAHTITDLLQLSRIARGELQLEDTDMSALTYELLDEMRTREPNRAVEFNIQPDMHARVDTGLMHLALQNLIGNAWKYTAERKRTIIEVGLRDEPGRKVFYVRDNGVGFDMADAQRIFAPFERAHTVKQFSGSGIGLSIVQRVVQKHGGEVWAESEKSKGACFYFSLPSVPGDGGG